ncbi:hypothetical protein D9M72_572500 [compost metagenome]
MCRRRHQDLRHRAAAFEIEPAVIAPDAFLQRRLAAERATTLRWQRPAGKMGVIGLTIRCFDILSVAGTLQRRLRVIL